MWFEDLTGFVEKSPEQVRENLFVSGNRIKSAVNGRSYICGELHIPSLAELRSSFSLSQVPSGSIKVREVISDATSLHVDPDNAGALFQVASQFNLLEMPSQHVSPERGVGVYEQDLTQGPACAVAAGAGTIYRCYMADVNGQTGQTANNQIDCLLDMGIALGADDTQQSLLRRRWTAGDVSPFEENRVNDPRPSARGLRKIRRHLRKHVPQLADVAFEETWAGMIDATPDVVPVMDEVDDNPGLFVATGFSGHGFGIGPGAGKVMADLVTGTKSEFDISRFRWGRFSDGSRIRPGPAI